MFRSYISYFRILFDLLSLLTLMSLSSLVSSDGNRGDARFWQPFTFPSRRVHPHLLTNRREYSTRWPDLTQIRMNPGYAARYLHARHVPLLGLGPLAPRAQTLGGLLPPLAGLLGPKR